MKDPGEMDHEWLLARERGEDVGDVLAARRAPYERLGELLGSGAKASAGWRQRVLDAIDAEEAAGRPGDPAVAPPRPPPVVSLEAARERRRSRRTLIVAGLAAAAAAAAILVIPRLGSRGPEAPQVLVLATEVRHGPTIVRGNTESPDEANLGDTLVVRAETVGPAELRVYGGSGERMLGSCNEGSGCTVEHDGERRRFVLEVKLEVPGQASAVVFLGASPPPRTGARSTDLEAAAGAGIPFEARKSIRVL